jgi:hypothetical protein
MGSEGKTNWKRWLGPLASRKVRVALATIAAAFAAQYGLHVSEDLILTILTTGVALILGIAHEDAAAKSAGGSDPSNP